MKKILSAILIGIFLAIPVQAIRFDWSLGQPTESLNNTAGTSTDSIWWVLGQPSVVASTTIAAEVPAEAAAEELQPEVIIIDFLYKPPITS